MKTAHTSGPWTVQQLETNHHGYDWQTFAIRSPQNVCLATVGDIDRYESERIPANAHLIAAAPDLLAALQTILPELEKREGADFWDEDIKRVAQIASAAITKATGGEK